MDSVSLVSKHVQVGENRFRERQGLLYEQFVIGHIYEHRPGRTITEVDNIWQSLLCMNTHPLHFDNNYGRRTEFGKCLVSSLVTFSIINGMSVSSTSGQATANLGWDKVRLLEPVFVGDTIYAESEVIGKRESRSRPKEGLISILTRGLKGDRSIFLEYQRTFLVPKIGYELDYPACPARGGVGV